MNNNDIAKRLIAGLTSEQLAGLLGRLLDRLPDTERSAFQTALDPEVAAVFRQLLEPPPAPRTATATGAKAAPGPTSDAKFTEQFHAVIEKLHDIFAKLGDEEGEYVVQEHHWEPPDFDACALARDIEEQAQELLPLLARAAALELEDEDLFLDLCQEISDGIGQYPEHIYTEEGVWLKSAATECVLKWRDLHTGSEAEFLDGFLAFDNESGSVSLDENTTRTYLLEKWPKERRCALYDAIQGRRSQDVEFRQTTDKPRTLWGDVRYALAGQFDSATRTAIAEASVAEDWTKGVALVDAAIAAGNPARAIEFCRKTLDAYYCRHAFGREGNGFDPGKTPLFAHWHVADESPTVLRILGLWADLAAKAGDTALAELLRVQAALFSQAEDWTAVRDAFAQARTADTAILCQAWKERTLAHQHGVHSLGAKVPDPAWPEWLLDAGFANRFDTFTDKAEAWLGERIGAAKPAPRGTLYHVPTATTWPPQMSLVADLFALAAAPERYPKLSAMLVHDCRLNDCPSRLEWLARADTARLTAAGIEFVRRNMARLMPSPEHMSADYAAAAGWLATAQEVAPDVASSTLQQWRAAYKRRRNLWRDLQQHGFDA